MLDPKGVSSGGIPNWSSTFCGASGQAEMRCRETVRLRPNLGGANLSIEGCIPYVLKEKQPQFTVTVNRSGCCPKVAPFYLDSSGRTDRPENRG